jgi:hypothetical protein
MKNWLYLSLSVAVIVLSLFLRLYKIENRAPFDWDQNRDYLAVEQITKGNLTLVGPVAKGDGGFLLAPLYYYLVTPGFLLSQGNPIALPITSAVLDVASIVLILALFPRIFGRWQTLALASLWSLSWFAIESSHISWNVALLQTWLVIFSYLLLTSVSRLKSLLLGLLLGLTWHIHAVIIPLSVLVFLIYLRRLKLSWSDLILVVFGYLVALSPLIIFDFRHAGLERSLIAEFLKSSGAARPTIGDILVSTLSRFGKNTVGIFTGESDLQLGWGIVTTIISVFAIFRGSMLARLSGYIILINLGLVLYLGEIRFPEYYLASAYLPVLIILIDVIAHFKTLLKPLFVLVVASFIYFNLQNYSTEKTSFSLAQKQSIVAEVGNHGTHFDIRYDLPYGRESGLPILFKRAGIVDSKQAKNQIIITESAGESVFVDGEIARDLGWFGGFRVAHRVVQ